MGWGNATRQEYRWDQLNKLAARKLLAFTEPKGKVPLPATQTTLHAGEGARSHVSDV